MCRCLAIRQRVRAACSAIPTLRRIAYPGAPGTTAIDGGFSELEYGGHNQTLRYDGIIGTSWLVEANVASSSNKFYEIATSRRLVLPDLRFTPNGHQRRSRQLRAQRGKQLPVLASSRRTSSAALAITKSGTACGLENIEFTRDFDYSGPNLLLSTGGSTVTGGPIQIRVGAGTVHYRATRGKLVPTDLTNQEGFSFFLQDTWQAGRLTIRPGVRYERQNLSGVDPGGDNPDLCFEGDTRPGQGDGTGPAIRCSFAWNNLAPRLGVTFDLTGTGRAKLFASYGRFYAKIPNDLAARSMSADAGITRQNYRDAALTQPVANGTSFAGTTTHFYRPDSTRRPSILIPAPPTRTRSSPAWSSRWPSRRTSRSGSSGGTCRRSWRTSPICRWSATSIHSPAVRAALHRSNTSITERRRGCSDRVVRRCPAERVRGSQSTCTTRSSSR